MDILAKNYLLYFLMCSLLIAGEVKKQEEIKFFDKNVQFFYFGEGCKECQEEETALTPAKNPSLPGKKVQAKEYKLLVFISLEDGEKNKKVISEIKQILTRNANVIAEGYLIDRVKNLKELALKNHFLFDKTFPFTFDPMMREAIKRKVRQVPLVIVEKNNREVARITTSFFHNITSVLLRDLTKLDK